MLAVRDGMRVYSRDFGLVSCFCLSFVWCLGTLLYHFSWSL